MLCSRLCRLPFFKNKFYFFIGCGKPDLRIREPVLDIMGRIDIGIHGATGGTGKGFSGTLAETAAVMADLGGVSRIDQ